MSGDFWDLEYLRCSFELQKMHTYRFYHEFLGPSGRADRDNSEFVPLLL
jgi:hypothetical protein